MHEVEEPHDRINRCRRIKRNFGTNKAYKSLGRSANYQRRDCVNWLSEEAKAFRSSRQGRVETLLMILRSGQRAVYENGWAVSLGRKKKLPVLVMQNPVHDRIGRLLCIHMCINVVLRF